MSPLRLALLWHQHQPLYRSPATGLYALPWVRLHGLKDYYDMAALALEHPGLRLTINLVPSLLDQLEEYASGRAVDPALDLARRPAADLDEEARLALLAMFFSVPYRTLISPFRRYAGLYHKRGAPGPDGLYRDALERFRPDDLRDLQVWFHLAWSGRTLAQRPEVRDLIRKGEQFTEEEKLALLAAQQELLREIVPIHRRLRDAGVAELSTSPAYHPILPLLCDLESAREAIPHLPLPSTSFRHPEDASWQIREGMRTARERFGGSVSGMWPSEGSLSVAALTLMGEAGVIWTASDEDVLRASAGRPLAPAEVHRPWRVPAAGERCPAVFFRDKELSDLIGFSYARWQPDAAAADFIARLRGRAAEAPGGVVSIILDGENAWEHYPGNGVEFLHALYEGLTRTEGIRTVTFSEALEGSATGALDGLRAGSWIGASFATWIGHPEKNRAWTLLSSAREDARRALGDGLHESAAFRALAAAEGSDWFWWFGEDHSSEQDAIFDAFFRDLLRTVYSIIGMPAPSSLDEPIKKSRLRHWAAPTAPITPHLDGRVSDFFEWLGAGVCEATSAQAAMHRGEWLVRRVAFGTDGTALFVRVDPERGTIQEMLSGIAEGILRVEMTAPRRCDLELTLRNGGLINLRSSSGKDGVADWAADRVLEARFPLEGLAPCEFFVSVESAGGPLQRLPTEGQIMVQPGQLADWSA